MSGFGSTEEEHRIIEAQFGKFPMAGNKVHSRNDIEDVRRALHAKGLLFAIRNSDGEEFDVVPDEVAMSLRRVCRIEIRRHGYEELLRAKYVRTKQYLTDMLTKNGVTPDRYASAEDLQRLAIDYVPPSVILGGLSPKDGLSMADLNKWCEDLGIYTSGSKSELIERIVGFYDQLRALTDSTEDPRAVYWEYFEALAMRDRDTLRGQQLIDKDIKIERKFEEATQFAFERYLGHSPLTLMGTAHADGVLSHQDKVILWDNKSKESPVELKEHIKQFEGYIRASEKAVAAFLVIGPSFTEASRILAMQYQVENGVPMCLLTADDMKQIVNLWEAKRKANDETKFPLGYLIQPGRFDATLLAAI